MSEIQQKVLKWCAYLAGSWLDGYRYVYDFGGMCEGEVRE